MLDRVLRHLPGVRRRPAGYDDDLVDAAQDRLVDAQLVEDQPARLVGAAEQGVRDGVRLLVDLLGHEARVAALLGGRGVPGDLVMLAVHRRPVEVGDLDRARGDRHDLVLAELDGVAGVPDEGSDVGAEEVVALADADHERGVAPSTDDDARARRRGRPAA